MELREDWGDSLLVKGACYVSQITICPSSTYALEYYHVEPCRTRLVHSCVTLVTPSTNHSTNIELNSVC